VDAREASVPTLQLSRSRGRQRVEVPAVDPMIDVGARTDGVLSSRARSSPPYTAPRPRVAVRSSMSGAPLQ
jgi:hypothetical protein